MIRKEEKLSTGAKVSVNDERVRVDLPPAPDLSSYQVISSAILNGGFQTFAAASNSQNSKQHVINYKVPSTYDGLNPPPLGLLTNFARKENLDPAHTVGLLTAASMESFAHSSRTAKGVSVDVIVTAGLSNSRSAGAEADYFVVRDETTVGEEKQEMKPGTINTIIIVNAPLTQEAQVESYAIAVEAKCNACVNHGVTCAKDATKFGMGTGTDCLALISQSVREGKNCRGAIKHAGKHTLFAEMVGQAVSEATSEAIMINIRYIHGNYVTLCNTMHQFCLEILCLIF